MKPNRNPHWSTSGLRVTLSSRIDVEIRLKGYKYFEIERDLFNELGVLIDGDFKFGVLLLVFVRFLETVNFLVFLLEEIGSDRAHCECMRRFASFVNCFLQN
jgi:hypothetical protein